MQLTEKEQEARKRVCLAVDVPTVEEGVDLAAELSDYVGTFKIGKELHTAAGNEWVNIVKKMYDKGGSTFLDLKLHDTPQTVYGASKACAVPGVYVFNLHVAGGEAMCKEAVEGADEGANAKGIERPKVIGVTVLTSLSDEDLEAQGLGIRYDDLVMRRTELALKWGLDGVVCAAKKAGALEKEYGEDFIKVTPGIKFAGIQNIGQKQLYTPDLAVRDCKNSILVIGSAITGAGNVYDDNKVLLKKGTTEDRQKAAYDILQVMAKEL